MQRKKIEDQSIERKEKRMIDLTSIKSCNLQELPIIGDRIEAKEQNTIRFYFENLNGICSDLWGIDKGIFL